MDELLNWNRRKKQGRDQYLGRGIWEKTLLFGLKSLDWGMVTVNFLRCRSRIVIEENYGDGTCGKI